MKELIKRGHVWWANLDPAHGTEPGKVRPVIVIQTDLVNNILDSTVVCILSTRLTKEENPLRVRIEKGEAGLSETCEVLIDQIRAIDNKRLIRHSGIMSTKKFLEVVTKVKIILDL